MSSPWQALADPNRRAVLELLLERPRPVGELVEQLGLSQPGTSKHLQRPARGGARPGPPGGQPARLRARPRPADELDVWLAPYRRLWNERLDALGRHLDDRTEED